MVSSIKWLLSKQGAMDKTDSKTSRTNVELEQLWVHGMHVRDAHEGD